MSVATYPDQHSSPVGRRVKFNMGNRELVGTIIADRGQVGASRTRLLSVRVDAEPFEPLLFDVPETEVCYVSEERVADLEKSEAIEFLREGGLLAILRANLSGGKNQPRVWLTVDARGNVTYTFIPEMGTLGGQTVPFLALQDEKIFLPKRDEVVKYLSSFGLSKAEAEDVVSSIGTVP